jgi:hypothetical protein
VCAVNDGDVPNHLCNTCFSERDIHWGVMTPPPWHRSHLIIKFEPSRCRRLHKIVDYSLHESHETAPSGAPLWSDKPVAGSWPVRWLARGIKSFLVPGPRLATERYLTTNSLRSFQVRCSCNHQPERGHRSSKAPSGLYLRT